MQCKGTGEIVKLMQTSTGNLFSLKDQLLGKVWHLECLRQQFEMGLQNKWKLHNILWCHYRNIFYGMKILLS